MLVWRRKKAEWLFILLVLSNQHSFTRTTSRSGKFVDIRSILLLLINLTSQNEFVTRVTPNPFDIAMSTQRNHLFLIFSCPDSTVTNTPSELFNCLLFTSLCWPLSTCDCDVIIVEKKNCLVSPSSPFVILCFWKIKDSFTYKNKPCKNVQDSYFIYLFLFLFVKKKKWLGFLSL